MPLLSRITSLGWVFVVSACGSTPIEPTGGAGPAGSPPPQGSTPAGPGGPGDRTAPANPETPTNPPPNPAPQPPPAPRTDPTPAPTPAPAAAAPVCVCPASPIDTAPLQTIQLDGSQSYDPAGSPLECKWTITQRPPGSTEPVGRDNASVTSFFVDLAGDYKFQLSCKNAAALECTPCFVVAHSNPDPGLSIVVTWDSPTVDVDLHMLRTAGGGDWFSSDDLYFGNRAPTWGSSNQSRCSLDIDDTDGYGPELINCRTPPSGASQTYKLGVHYYSDDGVGATRATIRIYCMGTLAAEAGPVTLQRTNVWWDVGTVTWPGCQVSITDPPQLTMKPPSNPLFP